jgi:hypothetical protein
MNKCGVVDKNVDILKKEPFYLSSFVNASVDIVDNSMNKLNKRMNKNLLRAYFFQKTAVF